MQQTEQIKLNLQQSIFNADLVLGFQAIIIILSVYVLLLGNIFESWNQVTRISVKHINPIYKLLRTHSFNAHGEQNLV